MAEALIEPERIKAIQESICGFLLDEVTNLTVEFYANTKISVGLADPNNDISDDEAHKYPSYLVQICRTKLMCTTCKYIINLECIIIIY